MIRPYDPLAVRVVLVAFEQSEKALKTQQGSTDLPDALRLRIADEILTLVDRGERNVQHITDCVLAKFAQPLPDPAASF